MHIFVADEHPRAVFRQHMPPCLTDSALAGFHDIAYGRGKGGAVTARKWLPFYPSSKARPLAVN